MISYLSLLCLVVWMRCTYSDTLDRICNVVCSFRLKKRLEKNMRMRGGPSKRCSTANLNCNLDSDSNPDSDPNPNPNPTPAHIRILTPLLICTD